MKVTVGSTNQTKVQAVIEAFEESHFLQGASVVGREVPVEQFGHPIGLDKVVAGAIGRARQAFQQTNYSVGIEGGLIAVPETKTGYMEVAACAIYDGQTFHLGLSPAYEWPLAVTDLIVNHGRDGSQALRQAGLTTEDKIGKAKGGVWLLTKGKLDRKNYNKLAIVMALIQLENQSLYRDNSDGKLHRKAT